MFQSLQASFSGELYFQNTVLDEAHRVIYSTDASEYQEKPQAVALPRTKEDIKQLIQFAAEYHLTLIPRAAGTSLAGQVVGSGIVVDISKHFTSILELNSEEKWVRVQPGVIRNDLNVYLKPHGLLFGPETSTANRAMIGGMIGNNSCGLHSIVWGTTRDNLLEVTCLLSDGNEVVFKELTEEEFKEKCLLPNLEGKIYNEIRTILADESNQLAIREGFPNPEIKRRNSGYALDFLLETILFSENSKTNFNFSKLIAGSEGTLCFITEAKLKVIDLPPPFVGLVAIHTATMNEALLANLVALEHHCYASELVDDFILEFTKTTKSQAENRFFIQGNPKAILMVEFFDETEQGVKVKCEKLVNDLISKQLGFAHPILFGDDTQKAWNLRVAGLGLLRNLPGDTKPVNLIEDCAVSPNDLPAYIAELEDLLKKHNLQYSMYAHAGAGELHVEPMINLKTSEGQKLFKTVLAETAALVKKYNGTLSGEHGDGRLRGEFIPFMMGEKNYQLFKDIKQLFDPKTIFNKGKITDSPPMNEMLRYEANQPKKVFNTTYNFKNQESFLRLAEKCSGSGDCRKTVVTGGTMCPSYMATRSERDTTRARANVLRQLITQSDTTTEGKLLLGESAKVGLEILDLCLSCKACKSECPSSVDVAKMKAEFLQQYYDEFGVPFRTKLIANFTNQMKLASSFSGIYNFVFSNESLRKIANNLVGFHPKRTMPLLAKQTFESWFNRRETNQQLAIKSTKKVYLFSDEFTNYNDVEIGKKLVELLQKLGYEILLPKHIESGRTYISKGLIHEAQRIANENVSFLSEQITEDIPLIGIEPSAILTLRDEYLDLVSENLIEKATKLAENTYLFEEWFEKEIEKGNIKKEQFTNEAKLIKLHGHCHQKSVASLTPTKKVLSFPINYTVQLIPSGCCGMAGSFGYEKEHYDVSMKIGELVLFPTVRQQPDNVLIAASGTSCRHQIKDGTNRMAKHPIEILWEALI